MVEYSRGLSYDDVLLVPKHSPVSSRSDVELNSFLAGDIDLDIPILSAPMDTVTDASMATALGEAGGFGTIHRFMDADEQAEQVLEAKRGDVLVGAAIGIDEDYTDRAEKVVSSGADALMVDVAHGHLTRTLNVVRELNAQFDQPTIAGNVATKQAVRDLAGQGADAVKIGVGPGSHCTTREVTGVGVPQLTAVMSCAQEAQELGVRIIADGGIRSSGDAVKALMAGADTVMMGSFFMGTRESPGEITQYDGRKVKVTRGMASEAASVNRDDKDHDATKPFAEEGVERMTTYKGDLDNELQPFLQGIRSGLSYCGGHSIAQARENSEFIEITPSTNHRNGAHEGF